MTDGQPGQIATPPPPWRARGHPTWEARKPSEPGHNESTSGAQPDATVPRPDDPAYVCARCGAFVAHVRETHPVAGATLHQRVNPHGFPHRFVTLRRCEAAAPLGDPSADFSWFDGCTWQVVLCRGCRVHLGWLFEGTDTRFYGVLTERLTERT